LRCIVVPVDRYLREGTAVNNAATLELTAEEALALLSMCALSIKSMDEDSHSALDKLVAYCKGLCATHPLSEA
jgi:endonuclease III